VSFPLDTFFIGFCCKYYSHSNGSKDRTIDDLARCICTSFLDVLVVVMVLVPWYVYTMAVA
jgi:hypothetical protein